MTIQGLAYMNQCLEDLGIPYEYMMWTGDLQDPYFVGEYSEIQTDNEDGLIESDFILTGTTKTNYLGLEQIKEQIRNYFTCDGLTDIMENGWGIAISYETAFPVPSIEEGVSRINITLRVKEWKGE